MSAWLSSNKRIEEKGKQKSLKGGIEHRFNSGGVIDVDAYYIRLGTFSFRQKWLSRDISQSLTGLAMLGLVGLGMVFGVLLGWFWCEARMRRRIFMVDGLETWWLFCVQVGFDFCIMIVWFCECFWLACVWKLYSNGSKASFVCKALV